MQVDYNIRYDVPLPTSVHDEVPLQAGYLLLHDAYGLICKQVGKQTSHCKQDRISPLDDQQGENRYN